MNVPTDVQVIKGSNGLPAFAIIPWNDYVNTLRQGNAYPAPVPAPVPDTVPNAVVGYMIKERLSAVAAWRKHLGLSQATVAARIGISQSAYAQQEAAAKPRKATREKIASALGITPELLDI